MKAVRQTAHVLIYNADTLFGNRKNPFSWSWCRALEQGSWEVISVTWLSVRALGEGLGRLPEGQLTPVLGTPEEETKDASPMP